MTPYHIVIVDNHAVARIDYDPDDAITYAANNVTLINQDFVTDYAAANSIEATVEAVLEHMGVINDLATGS